MEKLRVAVVGYGNIGRYAVDAVNGAPDMKLVGIVRRQEDVPQGVFVPVADDIGKLPNVDVALLCVPTRSVEEHAKKCLKMGICTVDSYDIHESIYELKTSLNQAAKEGGAAAVISAGWDPGTDSVVRAIMLASAPFGLTHTDFGPGMSMGHTVAAKAIGGVKNALSMTMPMGYGVHRRDVYIELEDGADFEKVRKDLLCDPYFATSDTHVYEVDDVNVLIDKGHGVDMVRKGGAGKTQNQFFQWKMTIDNPALTSQIMVACARAARRQAPGAYTMLEFPLIDLLPGGREEIIRALV
ncbi:MAG: diaminopimelate dehydrogenase [Clostridiales bacterium]|jgi:diaminopimelate dehydrogenase|nr:diaminopimelate dehydrogenase [Clostridiales bacterium]